MAGVDVTACDRSEFFIVGKPLFEVAKAENLAGKGELVVDKSVHQYTTLREKDFSFESTSDSDFHRVIYPDTSSVSTSLLSVVKVIDEEEQNRILLEEVQKVLLLEFDRYVVEDGRLQTGLHD
jgi:hypothetical protein